MGEFEMRNKQGVRSLAGFEVQVTSRFFIEYREGSKFIKIEYEIGMNGGNHGILYSPDAFEKWNTGELVPQEDRKRIKDNFHRAMNFQGVPAIAETAE